MAKASKYHPKSPVWGEIISIEKEDGEKNGKAWYRTNITIAQRTRGKWDADTREHATYENRVKITLFGTDAQTAARSLKYELNNEEVFGDADEILEILKGLQPRDNEFDTPGDELKVWGWVKSNSWPSKTETGKDGKPLWVTDRAPIVDDAEIDWAWVRDTKNKAQKELAEARAKAAAPVASAPATSTADDVDFDF